ncbi:MAG: RES family NAD+ phosphorylase [Actinomycetota bacterium]|nr:RES family NAD+ phosphorylase [Actinomycetota bacterium]
MYGPFPAARPARLRRRTVTVGTELWRIDALDPTEWDWVGFPSARFRFDPASGAFRVRYAGTSIAGAAREKYLDTGKLIPADHATRHLVHLAATRPLKVVDLRSQVNLDAIDVDDRINTSHEDVIWNACHRFADAVKGWWDEIDGIMYRSRTTPETSINVAFFSLDGFAVEGGRVLRTCIDELDDLVLHDQFTVGFQY